MRQAFLEITGGHRTNPSMPQRTQGNADCVHEYFIIHSRQRLTLEHGIPTDEIGRIDLAGFIVVMGSLNPQ